MTDENLGELHLVRAQAKGTMRALEKLEAEHARLAALQEETRATNERLCDALEALRAEAGALQALHEDSTDALLAEREAWRKAAGCDTPAEAQTAVELVAACVEGAEVERDQYRAAIHAQKDELARLRVLEARALEWLTAPTLAAGYHERPCACRFHALEAAIVACRAAKEGA